ncbi:MAG: hypothetical protein K2R98_05630 [Gemmataceae bacterium]|nr:hypothetical protein [Gemmataceae bacterium]
MTTTTNYDELQQTFESAGPKEAIERLCANLRDRKEYSSLFYALLMKKRYELGVTPMPSAPNAELPEEVHEPYENAIRDAGRLVGQLYLDDGDVLKAAPFFRMLNEPGPLMTALEKYQPFEGEDIQPIIELAFHAGVHPRKGFDWLVERYGICSAITLMGGHLNGAEFTHGPEIRDYCITKLIRSLHEQLLDRIRNDIVRREGSVDNNLSVTQLLAGREWLFEDDNYHVDVSHLSSVIQMAINLTPGEVLKTARELCHYGQQLSPRFHYQGEPPFEDQYKDYGVFLSMLDGENVDEGIAHFEAKVNQNFDPDGMFTQSAEILVNLLVRIGRLEKALEVARKNLQNADERQLSCPNVAELCRRVKDYRALADVSRERDDPVNFVAGLILANGKETSKLRN